MLRRQSQWQISSLLAPIRRLRSTLRMALGAPGITFGWVRTGTRTLPLAHRTCWREPGSVRRWFVLQRRMQSADPVRRIAMSVAWLTAVVPLAACSTPSWLCYLPSGVNRLTIVTQPDTNMDRAIAVDLVFVTQDPPAQEIGKLSARDYFMRRAQLLRDYPAAVNVRSWELAPEQLVLKADADPPCNLVQTYLFAGYATDGDHRATLSGASSVEVTLGADDLAVKQ
jgi:hypothetical protein